MAIDSQNKRASALSSPFNIFLPVADGTIGKPDRPQSIGIYAGLNLTLTGVVAALNLFNQEIICVGNQKSILLANKERSIKPNIYERSVIHYA